MTDDLKRYLLIARNIAHKFQDFEPCEAEVFHDATYENEEGRKETLGIVPGLKLFPVSVSFDENGFLFFFKADGCDAILSVGAETLDDLAPPWSESAAKVVEETGNPGISDEIYAVNGCILREIGQRGFILEEFVKTVDNCDRSVEAEQAARLADAEKYYSDLEDLGIFT